VNSLPLATIYEVKIPLRKWKKSLLQRNPAQMTWHNVHICVFLGGGVACGRIIHPAAAAAAAAVKSCCYQIPDSSSPYTKLLRNVAKHSSATRVHLTTPELVHDDGRPPQFEHVFVCLRNPVL
jgi:hypothetical protein